MADFEVRLTHLGLWSLKHHEYSTYLLDQNPSGRYSANRSTGLSNSFFSSANHRRELKKFNYVKLITSLIVLLISLTLLAPSLHLLRSKLLEFEFWKLFVWRLLSESGRMRAHTELQIMLNSLSSNSSLTSTVPLKFVIQTIRLFESADLVALNPNQSPQTFNRFCRTEDRPDETISHRNHRSNPTESFKSI